MKYEAIVLLLIIKSLLGGQVSSPSGLISFDIEPENQQIATLDHIGFRVGDGLAAANLHVSGNTIINEQLNLGSFSSSNLNLSGSLSQSFITVSSNTELNDHSMFFVDSSLGNIVLKLPDLSSSTGRQLTIKRFPSLNHVTISSGQVDKASSLMLPASQKSMSLNLFNDGSAWHMIDGIGLDNLLSQRKIFHAKLDENYPMVPIDSVSKLEANFYNLASANIGVSGNIGQAIEFNGDSALGSASYVTFAPGGVVESIFDMEVFTLSCRVYLKTPKETNHMVLIQRGASTELNYRLSIRGDNQKAYFRVRLRDSGAIKQTISSSALNTNQWYHLVAVHDGSSIQIYLDGSSSGTPTVTNALLKHGVDQGLDIGSSNASNSGFHGVLDDIRIYNHSLSASQVQLLFSDDFD